MYKFTIEIQPLTDANADGLWGGQVRLGTSLIAETSGWVNRADALRSLMATFEQRVARDGEKVFG